jgi:signal transduction histidine kinase
MDCFMLKGAHRIWQEQMLPTDASDSTSETNERAKVLRRILLIAFGGLLTLMIVASVSSLRSLRQLDAVEQEVNRRFSSRSQALAAIVVSVHVYNDQMERYLLQYGAVNSGPSAADVTGRCADAHAAVNNYPSERESQEQFFLQEIEKELAKEEASFTAVSTWRDKERRSRAQQFIGEQIIPRRTHIIQATRDMSALNNRRLNEENQILATKFQGLQSKLMIMTVLSLVAGLLLSVLSGVYILRLEQQGRLRYEALARSRRELEGLSARLVEVQEEERRSISRELHDEVGQTLGALLVDLGQLSNLVPAEDRAVQGQITRIKSAAETAVKSIRDMALLLRPPMLDDLGLIAALEWQAREISRRGEMEVEVHSENVSGGLGDETKVCIYRLTQEALNNAETHAGAKNAKVSVVQDAEKITVEIKDDGHGFDSSRVRGMGILGMEERVRRLGGSFAIESAPGKGATVRAEIPVHSAHVP